MAKCKIESPPVELELTNIEQMKQYLPYIGKYSATDEKGRYLHWDEFKWRVRKPDDVVGAWLAVKFHRKSMMKHIELMDEKGKDFQFCLPNSLQSKLHKIVKSAGGNVGAIAGKKAGHQIQQNFLVSSLLMEEAISSAQLEGASTTRRIAKKMLESEREPKDESERMIFNNYLLIQEAEIQKDEPLTVDLILSFHQLATMGTGEKSLIPGQFRKDDNVSVVDGIDGEIVYHPPSHSLILERMQALCDFANKDHSGDNGALFIDPVVKAIILHFMIGYEHPFPDGNGRTARALFYWYLLKNDYQIFKYLSISKLLKAAPIQYGKSYLYTETDENDLTYFIDYQAEVVIKAIQELLEYLQRKTDEYHTLMEWLENSPINMRLNLAQREIIKKAIKTPGRIFTAKEVKNDFSLSENTARKYLNHLAKLKLLAKFKEGKTMNYIAPANLRERIG